MAHLLGDDRRRAEALIVENHYTHSIPSGKSHWMNYGHCIVVFSIPANPNIGRFLLPMLPDVVVWELSRLWKPDGYVVTLSKAIAYATAAFKKLEPSADLIISYADPNAGHHGGVYRAASWIFLGQCGETRTYIDKSGQTVARRAFHSGSRFLLKAEIEALGYKEVKVPGKYRYGKPLKRHIRKKLLKERRRIVFSMS